MLCRHADANILSLCPALLIRFRFEVEMFLFSIFFLDMTSLYLSVLRSFSLTEAQMLISESNITYRAEVYIFFSFFSRSFFRGCVGCGGGRMKRCESV